MNLGEAQVKVVPLKKPIQITSDGVVVRSFGDYVQQWDGIPTAFNAAGTLYEKLMWETPEAPDAVERLCDALEIYLWPMISDEDFWSIEWRLRPEIERQEDRVHLRCRLVVHKRSLRPASGIVGCRDGIIWLLPLKPKKTGD